MDADLLSSEDIEVNPSTLDININMLGSNIRNIFRAIPGRKPWMNDLIVGLREKKSTKRFQGWGTCPYNSVKETMTIWGLGQFGVIVINVSLEFLLVWLLLRSYSYGVWLGLEVSHVSSLLYQKKVISFLGWGRFSNQPLTSMILQVI